MKCLPWIALFCLCVPARAQNAAAEVKTGEKRLDEDNPVDAIKHFDSALARDNGNLDALYGRGVARVQCHAAAEAIEDLSRILKVHPRDPYARYWRARAYGQQENGNQAVDDFTAALNTNEPFGADLRYSCLVYRGLNRKALGQLVGARSDMDAAIALDAARAEGWAGRARVRRAQGDETGARTDSAHAGAIDPALGTSLEAYGGFQWSRWIYCAVAVIVGLVTVLGAVPLIRSVALLAKTEKK